MCSICGKLFAQKKYLNRHMVTHNDEKPYGCDICLKSFRYKASLNNHMRAHADENPYKYDE
ncbi:Zinc finger protein 73, partial [Stegodyphus mimosarum]